jgi:hypothetical protein
LHWQYCDAGEGAMAFGLMSVQVVQTVAPVAVTAE